MENLARSTRLIDYSWWDTEAFADVRGRALAGQVSCDCPLAGPRPALNSSSAGPQSKPVLTKSLQASFYKILFAARFPFDLASVLLPRILKLLGGAYEEQVVLEAMRRTLRCVKKMAPQAGWALVRTWCNAWSTAVGSDYKPCIFGCDHRQEQALNEGQSRGLRTENKDSLKHYLVCPVLWGPIVQYSCTAWNVTWAICPINSLALAAINDDGIHDSAISSLVAATVAACDIYHTTKHMGGVRPRSNEFITRAVRESFRRLTVRSIFAISFKSARVCIRDSSLVEMPALYADSDCVCWPEADARERAVLTPATPACDPRPLDDPVDTTAATPEAQPVWEDLNTHCTHNSRDDDADGESTPRVKTLDAAGNRLASPRLDLESNFKRDICEPECDEMPWGVHHPCCSQFLLSDCCAAACLPRR